MSAAVLWSICDGGMFTSFWVETYLYLGSISWPFTKDYCATLRVIFPKVLAYKFYGFIAGT
jgi:hypothetical protein